MYLFHNIDQITSNFIDSFVS